MKSMTAVITINDAIINRHIETNLVSKCRSSLYNFTSTNAY